MSADCVDFWLDGPGDKTVRPIPPERLERAKAERAKILAAQQAGASANGSENCVDFWLEGPGDKTVRPIPPERLEQAKAERAKILAARAATSKTEN